MRTRFLLMILSFCLSCSCSQTPLAQGNIYGNDHSYIITDSSIGTDINIEYPQLNIITENAEEINTLIRRQSMEMIYRISETPNILIETGIYCKSSYDIKLYNDEMLSIVYEGDSSVQGYGTHRSYCFSLNIDLITNRRLSLSNFISEEDLRTRILGRDFRIHDGSIPGDQLLETICTPEIIAADINKYFLFEESNDDLENQNEGNASFYLLENHIGLIIEVEDAENNYFFLEIAV